VGNSIGRRYGAVGLAGGAVSWRVWAPAADRVDLVLFEGGRRRAVAMEPDSHGNFQLTLPNIPEGQRYVYRLAGGPERPDPCSLWQPDGAHGPSAVVRPGRFAWSDRGWQGVRREDLVVYELHVGTFTPAGTFEAVIPRLPQLRELGATAVEPMPVAQFPGTRNWGYDGVGLYAAQDSYGGPDGLQKLVDAAHTAGLAVFLDVVYNHLGPEGNYLREFGPYFTDRYRTPWGEAVNFDGPDSEPVRDFVLDNARMWLDEFHLDGLRLDAVHAIFDLGARHILRAIQEVADDVAGRSRRAVHVIAESDLNDPRLLLPPGRGGYGLDAQWADDFHHAIHTCLSGERNGYYADFGEIGQLARALGEPFLYAGDFSPHRRRKHGAPPAAELTGDRFVVCLQNHDQVGNRARGDRLSTLVASPARQRLAGCLLLFSPYTPLLFMGEEYGEENPFPFFCSFGDAKLIEAVRQGRKQEFAAFAWQGEVPDPHAEATFATARLSWSWPEGSTRAGLRRLYQDLLAARRHWPALRDRTRRPGRLLPDPEKGPLVELVRGAAEGEAVRILFNFGDGPQPLPVQPGAELLFSSEHARYGGDRREGGSVAALAPQECIALRSLGPPSPAS
jgi:maltooligosyltrehalose trehalohydrolase